MDCRIISAALSFPPHARRMPTASSGSLSIVHSTASLASCPSVFASEGMTCVGSASHAIAAVAITSSIVNFGLIVYLPLGQLSRL